MVSKSSAGITDGLSDSEKRRLFAETKKIFENLNSVIRDLKGFENRLEDFETKDIENLKQTHAEIISQIEMIRKLIPNLRGMVEQSEIDLTRRIDQLKTHVVQTMSKLETDLKQQEQVRKNFASGILADLGQLQQGIEKDMGTFAELNKQSFGNFSKANSEAFQKVVENINKQKQQMSKANSDLIKLLRVELFPAIQDIMIKNFSGMESKNEKMVEILKKSLQVQQATNKKIALLEENLAKANDNVKMVGGAVKELGNNLGKKVDTLIQGHLDLTTRVEKINRIAEILEALKSQSNSVGNSLNTLHASVARLQEISSHAEESISKQNDITVKTVENFSDQLGQKLDQSYQKASEGVADGKMNQEKIDKMIGILEVVMGNNTSRDEKINHAIWKIEQGQTNDNLANEKLSKLIEILKLIVKSQGGLEQVQKDQITIKEFLAKGQTSNNLTNEKLSKFMETLKAIVRTQVGLKQIQEDQVAIKKSIADLKRKANVNISRNDDIKKVIKKIQKTLPKPAQ